MYRPRLVIKLGSIMIIQIMQIEPKFYSANVCFTLLCAEVQAGLRELTMSYSYVKCFEESVVWNISRQPHVRILPYESNIICIQLVANRERKKSV